MLREAMPLDGWCGHTLDPATAMPTGGDSREGYKQELVTRLLEIEYRVGDVNPFNGLLAAGLPVGTIREATGGAPETSPRYREVVIPSGFEHEMRIVFRHQGRPWGAIVLLRADDAPAFDTTRCRADGGGLDTDGDGDQTGTAAGLRRGRGSAGARRAAPARRRFRASRPRPRRRPAGSSSSRTATRTCRCRSSRWHRPQRTAQARRCAAGRGCRPAPG